MDLDALGQKSSPKVKAGFSKHFQPCSAGTRGGSCLDYDVHLCICNGMRTAMFDECILFDLQYSVRSFVDYATQTHIHSFRPVLFSEPHLVIWRRDYTQIKQS